jgi:hypothetical protein
MLIDSPVVLPTPTHVAELDRLGDEIAELSAHLDAATARLLALSGIRWWSTWTPRCWRTRSNPANLCWKRGATFPRNLSCGDRHSPWS